jgi:hypothetical protein
VSIFSNKTYSRNFLINSKVILYNIFYDTSVNFYCIYPLLYTTGMCEVTFIEIQNTYTANVFCSVCTMICVASRRNSHCYSLCPATYTFTWVQRLARSHAYTTSWTSSLCTDWRCISCRNTACSVFEIRKHCPGSGRSQSLYLFLRLVIKQTAVTIEAYHAYQLHTEFYPIFFCQC